MDNLETAVTELEVEIQEQLNQAQDLWCIMYVRGDTACDRLAEAEREIAVKRRQLMKLYQVMFAKHHNVDEGPDTCFDQ